MPTGPMIIKPRDPRMYTVNGQNQASTKNRLTYYQYVNPYLSQTTISIERLLFAWINVAIERLVFQNNFLIQYQLCMLSRQILYKKLHNVYKVALA